MAVLIKLSHHTLLQKQTEFFMIKNLLGQTQYQNLKNPKETSRKCIQRRIHSTISVSCNSTNEIHSNDP